MGIRQAVVLACVELPVPSPVCASRPDGMGGADEVRSVPGEGPVLHAVPRGAVQSLCGRDACALPEVGRWGCRPLCPTSWCTSCQSVAPLDLGRLQKWIIEQAERTSAPDREEVFGPTWWAWWDEDVARTAPSAFALLVLRAFFSLTFLAASAFALAAGPGLAVGLVVGAWPSGRGVFLPTLAGSALLAGLGCLVPYLLYRKQGDMPARLSVGPAGVRLSRDRILSWDEVRSFETEVDSSGDAPAGAWSSSARAPEKTRTCRRRSGRGWSNSRPA